MRNIYTADLMAVQLVDKLARVLRKEAVEKIGDEPQGLSGGVPRTFYVDSGESRSASTNSGLEPSVPFSTLQQALNACSANRGDVIYLAPGHAETITTAITTPAGAAGASIIGLGKGRTRPTFTGNTGATAKLLSLSQADMTLRNVVFMSSSATATDHVDVTGTDCEIADCEFNQGASDADSIILDTGASRAYIHDCTWRITANGPTEHILINQATVLGVRIEDCRFHEMSLANSVDNACIYSTVAHLDCIIKNVVTDFGMVVSFTSATSTGSIIDAWPGQIGTAGSQIRIGGCALFGGPAEGYLTRVSDVIIPQTGNTTLGTVTGATGARILLKGLVGQVGTLAGAGATNGKIIAHPSAGTDVDLCAATSTANAEANALFAMSNTGLVATGLVVSNAGGGVVNVGNMNAILNAGVVLRFNESGNSGTGTAKWDTWWRPLDPGASFV